MFKWLPTKRRDCTALARRRRDRLMAASMKDASYAQLAGVHEDFY